MNEFVVGVNAPLAVLVVTVLVNERMDRTNAEVS